MDQDSEEGFKCEKGEKVIKSNKYFILCRFNEQIV